MRSKLRGAFASTYAYTRAEGEDLSMIGLAGARVPLSGPDAAVPRP